MLGGRLVDDRIHNQANDQFSRELEAKRESI